MNDGERKKVASGQDSLKKRNPDATALVFPTDRCNQSLASCQTCRQGWLQCHPNHRGDSSREPRSSVSFIGKYSNFLLHVKIDVRPEKLLHSFNLALTVIDRCWKYSGL